MTNTGTTAPATSRVRCGNCSAWNLPAYHATVDAVRACYAAKYAPAPAAPAPVIPAPVAATLPGLYRMAGTIYRARLGKTSGKLFAERLTQTGTKWIFTYTPGAVKHLTTAMILTADEAATFGIATGWCCACARHLTHPASVAVGYGPICADHNGWPHSYTK